MTDHPTQREQEILGQLLTEGLYARMRARAKRRKSPWNLLLIPLALGGIAATWYGVLWLIVCARNFALHQHLATVGALMRSDCQGVASVVCFVSSFLASIPFGGLVRNCIVWCIPPIRRVFAKEARGVWHASFAEAQRDLLLVALYVSLPALLLALGGGILMRCS